MNKLKKFLAAFAGLFALSLPFVVVPAASAATPAVVVQGATFKSAGPAGFYRFGSPYYYDNSGATVNRFTDSQKVEIFSVWGTKPDGNVRLAYTYCNRVNPTPVGSGYTCKLTYKPGYLDMTIYKYGVLQDPRTVPVGYAFSIYAVLYR